jgi:hypothetical protein
VLAHLHLFLQAPPLGVAQWVPCVVGMLSCCASPFSGPVQWITWRQGKQVSSLLNSAIHV